MLIIDNKFKDYKLKLMDKSALKLKVAFGRKITVKRNNEINIWEVVYPGEGNSADGKISIDAPLIQMILGMTNGDTIKSSMHGQEVIIEILKVE